MIAKLQSIEPGRKAASAYQREMLGILNHLFEPELTDGKLEEATIHGTERRDIIFTNEAERSFWQYIRQQYNGFLVMFEAKNVGRINGDHINQVATYLGERIGRFGVILTRHSLEKTQLLKTIAVYNDSHPKKIILVLHDGDIEVMLQLKDRGDSPTKHIKRCIATSKSVYSKTIVMPFEGARQGFARIDRYTLRNRLFRALRTFASGRHAKL